MRLSRVHGVELKPLTEALAGIYIDIGIQSYGQHYLHLWPQGDPSPYIESSFTTEVVKRELLDTNAMHFLITQENETVGILKVILNAPLEAYPGKNALLLEKIYLLQSFSGRGIGKICLSIILEYAKSLEKEILWLDTMKKGRALSFYQDFGFRIVGEKRLPFKSALEDQKAMYILAYEIN